MEELKRKLKLLPDADSEKLLKWFGNMIHYKVKEIKHPSCNFKPYVKRRDIIWVDFGENVGQELSEPHLAIVIYASDNRGTLLVVPLTKEEHTNIFVVNLGPINGIEQTQNYAKIDQIKSISKLRILKKFNKCDSKYYDNYNRITNQFNNPKANSKQMDIIDLKISEFRRYSK